MFVEKMYSFVCESIYFKYRKHPLAISFPKNIRHLPDEHLEVIWICISKNNSGNSLSVSTAAQ